MNIERISEMLREAGEAIIARSSELPINAPWITIEIMPRGFHVRGSVGRGNTKRSYQSTVTYDEFLTNESAENPLIYAIDAVDIALSATKPVRTVRDALKPRPPEMIMCSKCYRPFPHGSYCHHCNP